MPEDLYAKFQDLVGECMDTDPEDPDGSKDISHMGEKGWIHIKSFSFGFGFPGKNELAGKPAGTGGKTDPKAEMQKLKADIADLKKKPAEKDKEWGTSGALKFDRVNISKNSDLMSNRLIQLCHSGKAIKKVVIEACRTGANLERKLPFLRLTFEEVHLKSCNLSLVSDELPSEEVQFEYSIVRMESLWTDNAIGDRKPSQPMKAGWDLENVKQA